MCSNQTSSWVALRLIKLLNFEASSSLQKRTYFCTMVQSEIILNSWHPVVLTTSMQTFHWHLALPLLLDQVRPLHPWARVPKWHSSQGSSRQELPESLALQISLRKIQYIFPCSQWFFRSSQVVSVHVGSSHDSASMTRHKETSSENHQVGRTHFLQKLPLHRIAKLSVGACVLEVLRWSMTINTALPMMEALLMCSLSVSLRTWATSADTCNVCSKLG